MSKTWCGKRREMTVLGSETGAPHYNQTVRHFGGKLSNSTHHSWILARSPCGAYLFLGKRANPRVRVLDSTALVRGELVFVWNASHCNMQHTATCSTAQHTARRNALVRARLVCVRDATHFDTQHSATRCNTHYTATCNTLQHTMQHWAHCSTLQHALHCNMQHTATHTALHTAPHCDTHCNMHLTATHTALPTSQHVVTRITLQHATITQYTATCNTYTAARNTLVGEWLVCAWHDSFICVTWLIQLCSVTHSCVWHDSSMRVTRVVNNWVVWVTHMNDILIWPDSLNAIRAKFSFIHDMTHLCVWPMCVTAWVVWVTHMNDIHIWHDSLNSICAKYSFIYDITH